MRLVPRNDLLVVMGDLNAKVGNNNTNMDRVIGKYGCGTINDIIELCACPAGNSVLSNWSKFV